MKKILVGIIVVGLGALLINKFFFSKPSAPVDTSKPAQPLSISKNSEAFNASFGKILDSYFSLKEALADYDTARANVAASQLTTAATDLKTNEIKGDSTGDIKRTAADFSATISNTGKELVHEPDLTKKKRAFNTISEALYNLVRTVRYDRQKLYHQHCPMAFNENEEAFWISNSSKIDNPYLGRKHPKYKAAMADCGDVTDSLDFSK